MMNLEAREDFDIINQNNFILVIYFGKLIKNKTKVEICTKATICNNKATMQMGSPS